MKKRNSPEALVVAGRRDTDVALWEAGSATWAVNVVASAWAASMTVLLLLLPLLVVVLYPGSCYRHRNQRRRRLATLRKRQRWRRSSQEGEEEKINEAAASRRAVAATGRRRHGRLSTEVQAPANGLLENGQAAPRMLLPRTRTGSASIPW